MLSFLKNLISFHPKSSLRVTAFIASSMSSTTRTSRSRTSVKAENETQNDKETENGPQTSKYFQKKLIKKELGVLENVEKSVRNARALKSKPKDQGSKVSAKLQAHKTVVKAEFSIPNIVITEALNDNFDPRSPDDSEITNEQKTVTNKVSTKKIKIDNKGKTRKTVIKTEQISPKKVKTEVLSDEEFTSVPTEDNSSLGLEKDSKNKISPKERKQVQKASIKTKPNSSNMVKTEVLSGEEFTSKPTKNDSALGIEKDSKNKVSPKKRNQVQKPSIKTELNSIEIVKTELLSEEESTAMSPRKRKQVQKDKKSTKFKTDDIEDMGWQPDNWRIVLDNILEMRKWQTAPVDMMGCEECPEKGVSPEVFRYQTLISVMLSSQTRDEVTYAATQRLIAHGLTVDSILATSDEKIGELIYPAGFWKSKVKFIRNTTQILKDQYNGDIPRTFKDLCKLPGVGPKMANIVMSVGWKETVGIAVDTHVHRISNRLGWVPKQTKDPEQTRKALEAWLPKEHWDPINITMVGFGQTICRPVGPSCHRCLNSELCPFGRSALKGGLKKSPKK